MKENKYDDPSFFDAYSHFPRSVEGLSAAGEWHAFKRLLPDFSGKRVLDLGCGFGWHVRYAAEHGASRVVGTDISEKMLAVAREKTPCPAVEFLQVATEDVRFAPDSFDVVISSLAFHYTEDFAAVARRVYGFLTPGGDFVFSVEHPVFTAEGSQQWITDEAGRRLHWPVDRYFAPGARKATFLSHAVTKYHRTLTGYVGPLLEAGFSLTGLVEPEPDPALLDSAPGLADERRRPMMLLLSARKPKKETDG